MHLRVVLHLWVGLALLASVGWATTFFLEVKAEVVLTRLDHGNRTVMRRPEPHAMQLLSQGTNVFTMAAARQETIASTTGVAASTIVDHSAVVRP